MPNSMHTASWLLLFLGHFADNTLRCTSFYQCSHHCNQMLQQDARGCYTSTSASHTTVCVLCLLLIAAVRNFNDHVLIQDASSPCHGWLIVVSDFIALLQSQSHLLCHCWQYWLLLSLFLSVASTITAHHSNTWCPFLCPMMLFLLPLSILPF